MTQLSQPIFRQRLLPLAITGALALSLGACGGSSSSNRGPATDVGQFKDSNVEGPHDRSGSQAGLTDASGAQAHYVNSGAFQGRYRQTGNDAARPAGAPPERHCEWLGLACDK